MVLLDMNDLLPSKKMKEQKVSAKEEKERRVDELAVKHIKNVTKFSANCGLKL